MKQTAIEQLAIAGVGVSFIDLMLAAALKQPELKLIFSVLAIWILMAAILIVIAFSGKEKS